MSFTHVITFDSLAEMIEVASAHVDHHDRRASQTVGDRGFYFTDTFGEAVEIATTGFTEAQERAEAIASEIASKVRRVMTETQALEYDETGSVLDFDAYLSGEANCTMIPAVHHQQAVAPTCRILVNCAFSGATSTDFFIQQGSVVLALCDLLREAGYSTEVWAASTNHGGGKRNTIAAKVKAFDDFGSVSSMLFGLAHPSFQRRLVWSVREHQDADFRRTFSVGGDYGIAGEPEIPGEEFDITIGSGSSVTRDPVRYILSTLKGLGVEIES